jgi:hypothetical protein
MVFPQYPEYIKLSESRHPVYYLIGQHATLPKKFKAPHFGYKNGKLFDTRTKSHPIKNKALRDAPRMMKINGQALWVGMNEYSRVKLRDQLHHYFSEEIRKQFNSDIVNPPGHYLHIEFVFYFPFSKRRLNQIQDIDNHAIPYSKTFSDTLTNDKYVIDDDPRFRRGVYSRYVEVATEEERRLVVNFYHLKNNNDE